MLGLEEGYVGNRVQASLLQDLFKAFGGDRAGIGACGCRPRSNLEINRVLFLAERGIEGSLNPKKGNKGLVWSQGCRVLPIFLGPKQPVNPSQLGCRTTLNPKPLRP